MDIQLESTLGIPYSRSCRMDSWGLSRIGYFCPTPRKGKKSIRLKIRNLDSRIKSHAVLRLKGWRRSLTNRALVFGFIRARSVSHAHRARSSSARKGYLELVPGYRNIRLRKPLLCLFP